MARLVSMFGEGYTVVFRKDAKADTFQRQISALRQQLGPEEETASPARASYPTTGYDAVETSAPLARFGAPIAPVYEPEESVAPMYEVPAYDVHTSIVAHDTVWNGDLQTSGTLHIHGRVDGTVTAKADVFVAEEAEVDATITAVNLAVAGQVRGTIRCSGRLEVLPQGRINGDVFAQVLVIHEGATVNGQFTMTDIADVSVSPLRRRVASAGA